MWGNYGEAMQKYLHKGTWVQVVGEMQQKRWEKDGVHNEKFNLIISELTLLAQPKNKKGQKKTVNENDLPPDDFGTDDIPF